MAGLKNQARPRPTFVPDPSGVSNVRLGRNSAQKTTGRGSQGLPLPVQVALARNVGCHAWVPRQTTCRGPQGAARRLLD